MTLAFVFRPCLAAFAIGAASNLWVPSQAQTPGLLKSAQTQPQTAPDASIQKTQEALVWTGYYDGPVDGSAGAGTQSAIKKFQRDIGRSESGILDDAQAAILAQRSTSAILATGDRSVLDNRTGLRIGVPLALAGQRRDGSAGTDYLSSDGRIQISLRTFRSSQDFSSVYNQLKERFSAVSQIAYSPNRGYWFVIAGESPTKKYYVRYHSSRDLISGFFSVSDKSLSKETNSLLVSSITFASLTMQTFASDVSSSSIPLLTNSSLLEPVALAVNDASPVKDNQASNPANPPSPTAAPAVRPQTDDATLQNLQKKLSEMEATQRRLEQELETSRARKAEPPGQKTSVSKEDAPSTRDMTGYEMLGLLGAAFLVLIVLAGRFLSPGGKADGRARRRPAPPKPEETTVAQQPVSSTQELAAETTLVPAPQKTTEQPRQQAAGTRSSGLGVIVSLGGMIAVVLLVAFLVDKVSSISGF